MDEKKNIDMIPSVEERQIRSCNICCRYNPNEKGSRKCSKDFIGPRDPSLPDSTRDSYNQDAIKEWPCIYNLTQEEFLECCKTHGYQNCKDI